MAQDSEQIKYLRLHGLMGDSNKSAPLPSQKPFSASMVPLRRKKLPVEYGTLAPTLNGTGPSDKIKKKNGVK